MIEFSYFQSTILVALLYWINSIVEMCVDVPVKKAKITAEGDFWQPSSEHRSFTEKFLVLLIINLMWGERQDFNLNMPA